MLFRSGLFDDIDVNSNKLGATVEKRNKKLASILSNIADMKLGNYQDNTIDAFGDAYEFLMSMYASNAGKSGGEFFTPQEVSELLTRLATVGLRTLPCGFCRPDLRFRAWPYQQGALPGQTGEEPRPPLRRPSA